MNGRILLLGLAAAISVSACTRRVNAGTDTSRTTTTSVTTQPASSGAPTLTSLTPDSANVSVGAVTTMIIRGTGFETGTPGTNIVEIGPAVINSVPANATGTELRVVVPQTYRLRGGAPPQRIMPGEYDVIVRTSKGASNALKLRVQ